MCYAPLPLVCTGKLEGRCTHLPRTYRIMPSADITPSFDITQCCRAPPVLHATGIGLHLNLAHISEISDVQKQVKKPSEMGDASRFLHAAGLIIQRRCGFRGQGQQAWTLSSLSEQLIRYRKKSLLGCQHSQFHVLDEIT